MTIAMPERAEALLEKAKAASALGMTALAESYRQRAAEFADGNSSAEKSARAKKQLRDRLGRWIYMGGRIRWKGGIGAGSGKWFHGEVVEILPMGGNGGKDVVSVKMDNGKIVTLEPKNIENVKAKLKTSNDTSDDPDDWTGPEVEVVKEVPDVFDESDGSVDGFDVKDAKAGQYILEAPAMGNGKYDTTGKIYQVRKASIDDDNHVVDLEVQDMQTGEVKSIQHLDSDKLFGADTYITVDGKSITPKAKLDDKVDWNDPINQQEMPGADKKSPIGNGKNGLELPPEESKKPGQLPLDAFDGPAIKHPSHGTYGKGSGVKFWNSEKQDFLDGQVTKVSPGKGGQEPVWASVAGPEKMYNVNKKNVFKVNYDPHPSKLKDTSKAKIEKGKGKFGWKKVKPEGFQPINGNISETFVSEDGKYEVRHSNSVVAGDQGYTVTRVSDGAEVAKVPAGGDPWDAIDKAVDADMKTPAAGGGGDGNDPNPPDAKPERGPKTPKFEILPADMRGKSGDGYHPSGPWGKYGASGVLMRNVDKDGVERFLLVQRSLTTTNNKGQWQLPGGALDEKEDAYQAAARETFEEIGATKSYLGALKPTGEIVSENSGGWKYTSITADANTMLTPNIAGELNDAQWMTKDDIDQLKVSGKMHPALAANIDNLLEQFDTPDVDKSESDVSDEDLESVADIDPDAPAAAPEAADPTANFADVLDGSAWTKAPSSEVDPQITSSSHSGSVYKDENGKQWYVKKMPYDDHGKTEVLTSALYRKLGVSAAEARLIKMPDGTTRVASAIVPDHKKDAKTKRNDADYRKAFSDGFTVDAWLANRDVAGANYDNVVSDADGKPVRIDTGGAINMRATGGQKKGPDFTDKVHELDTFLDSTYAPKASKLFQGVTQEQMKAGAQKIANFSDDDIDSMVDAIGLSPTESDLAKYKLKARRQDIMGRFGVSPQAAGSDDTSKPSEPDVAPADTTPSVPAPPAPPTGPPPPPPNVAPSGEPFYLSKNGVPIYMGDVVKSTNPNKPFEGTVTKVEPNNTGYVHVKDASGKKVIRKADTLVHVNPPQSSEPDATDEGPTFDENGTAATVAGDVTGGSKVWFNGEEGEQKGTVEGITPDGEVVITDESGMIQTVPADEIIAKQNTGPTAQSLGTTGPSAEVDDWVAATKMDGSKVVGKVVDVLPGGTIQIQIPQTIGAPLLNNVNPGQIDDVMKPGDNPQVKVGDKITAKKVGGDQEIVGEVLEVNGNSVKVTYGNFGSVMSFNPNAGWKVEVDTEPEENQAAKAAFPEGSQVEATLPSGTVITGEVAEHINGNVVIYDGQDYYELPPDALSQYDEPPAFDPEKWGDEDGPIAVGVGVGYTDSEGKNQWGTIVEIDDDNGTYLVKNDDSNQNDTVEPGEIFEINTSGNTPPQEEIDSIGSPFGNIGKEDIVQFTLPTGVEESGQVKSIVMDHVQGEIFVTAEGPGGQQYVVNTSDITGKGVPEIDGSDDESPPKAAPTKSANGPLYDTIAGEVDEDGKIQLAEELGNELSEYDEMESYGLDFGWGIQTNKKMQAILFGKKAVHEDQASTQKLLEYFTELIDADPEGDGWDPSTKPMVPSDVAFSLAELLGGAINIEADYPELFNSNGDWKGVTPDDVVEPTGPQPDTSGPTVKGKNGNDIYNGSTVLFKKAGMSQLQEGVVQDLQGGNSPWMKVPWTDPSTGEQKLLSVHKDNVIDAVPVGAPNVVQVWVPKDEWDAKYDPSKEIPKPSFAPDLPPEYADAKWVGAGYETGTNTAGTKGAVNYGEGVSFEIEDPDYYPEDYDDPATASFEESGTVVGIAQLPDGTHVFAVEGTSKAAPGGVYWIKGADIYGTDGVPADSPYANPMAGPASDPDEQLPDWLNGNFATSVTINGKKFELGKDAGFSNAFGDDAEGQIIGIVQSNAGAIFFKMKVDGSDTAVWVPDALMNFDTPSSTGDANSKVKLGTPLSPELLDSLFHTEVNVDGIDDSDVVAIAKGEKDLGDFDKSKLAELADEMAQNLEYVLGNVDEFDFQPEELQDLVQQIQDYVQHGDTQFSKPMATSGNPNNVPTEPWMDGEFTPLLDMTSEDEPGNPNHIYKLDDLVNYSKYENGVLSAGGYGKIKAIFQHKPAGNPNAWDDYFYVEDSLSGEGHWVRSTNSQKFPEPYTPPAGGPIDAQDAGVGSSSTIKVPGIYVSDNGVQIQVFPAGGGKYLTGQGGQPLPGPSPAQGPAWVDSLLGDNAGQAWKNGTFYPDGETPPAPGAAPTPNLSPVSKVLIDPQIAHVVEAFVNSDTYPDLHAGQIAKIIVNGDALDNYPKSHLLSFHNELDANLALYFNDEGAFGDPLNDTEKSELKKVKNQLGHYLNDNGLGGQLSSKPGEGSEAIDVSGAKAGFYTNSDGDELTVNPDGTGKLKKSGMTYAPTISADVVKENLNDASKGYNFVADVDPKLLILNQPHNADKFGNPVFLGTKVQADKDGKTYEVTKWNLGNAKYVKVSGLDANGVWKNNIALSINKIKVVGGKQAEPGVKAVNYGYQNPTYNMPGSPAYQSSTPTPSAPTPSASTPSAPSAPYVPPPAGVPDPSATPEEIAKWKGNPAPQPPVPFDQSPATDNSKYLSPEFIQKLKDHYAQWAINTNAPKKQLEQSSQWTNRLQKVINDGNLTELEYLYKKTGAEFEKYFNDELYEEAKQEIAARQAIVAQNAAILQAAAAAHQLLEEQYSKDLKSWEKANGLGFSATGFVPRGLAGAKDWSSHQEGLSFGKAHWPKASDGFWSGLSAALSSIKSYTGSLHHGLNKALYNKGKSTMVSLSGISSQYTSHIQNMDKAFAKMQAVAPFDYIVHRGVGADAFKLPDNSVMNSNSDFKAIVGSIQPNYGFSSTSVGTTAAFSGHTVQMKIRVPKEWKSVFVGQGSSISHHTSEREMILDRGARYYIHKAYKQGGKWFLEAEIVPADWMPDSDYKPVPPEALVPQAPLGLTPSQITTTPGVAPLGPDGLPIVDPNAPPAGGPPAAGGPI